MGVQYEIKIYNGTLQMDYQINTYITIFSVLEGEAQLKFEKGKVDLQKGELYVMNFGKLYGLVSSSDVVISKLEINYEELLKESGKQNLKFSCDTLKDSSKNHYSLKKAYSKLLSLHVMEKRKFEELGTFYELLSILMKKYALNTEKENRTSEDNKMLQVRLYLHTHYNEKITLEDICARFYFATSTFTRNFKKQTGKSMVQYLNGIRIQSAKQLLLEENRSVTDVAMEVGFTDVATFTKLFKKLNGISPLKFKQQILSRDNQQIKNDELIDMVEKTFLIEKNNAIGKNVQKNKVQRKNITILDRPWNQGVGVQHGKDLLESSVQQSVLQLHKEMGLKYVRIPFVLSDHLIQTNGTIVDYSKVDQILDFVLSNEMIPIVSLSGRKQIVHTKGTMLAVEEVSEYNKGKEEYQKQVMRWIHHVFARYSGTMEGLSKWIWELQYERKKYSIEEYVSLFRIFSDEVHKWDADCLFGGYGIDLYDWNENEIRKLSKLGFQPDFFAMNMYPYQCQEKKDGIRYMKQKIDASHFQNEMIKVKEMLVEHGYEDMPIFVTQWNTTLENRTILNDSYIKPAMAMSFILNLTGLAKMFLYDVACDSTENQTDVFFGGRGLVSKDGIEKPIVQAFKGMGAIGSNMVIGSEHTIFGYSGTNRLNGLCFNSKNVNMSYYQKAESNIQEDEISRFFDDQDTLVQEISIADLANGVYRIRLMICNEENSVLSRLKKMGEPTYLDASDLQYIKSQSAVNVQLMEEKTKEGILKFSVSLKPNEMAWVQIFPIQLEDEWR